MKHIKRTLALILALVMLLTPMISVSAAETAQDKDTLIVFDLEAFLQTLNSDVEKYDFFKFATALQGLVNRDEPQLYFLFSTNYAASTQGYDMDEYWLDKITDDELGYGELKDGRDLADFEIVTSMSFWKIVEKFSDYYNGLVVWDSDVPASANVASTIAGVENLLPVRYAPVGNNLYAQLMRHGFTKDDIKRDLTGLFTGEGYIPTLGSSVPGAKIEYTTTPSTKSIKADPYMWAKMFYLDTGLTNPLSMTFSLDAGGDKIKQKADKLENGAEPKFDAKLVSAYIPKNMAPGGVSPVKLVFENTGTETWDSSYVRAGIPSGQFRVYNDEDCETYTTSWYDRFPSVYCEPGEQATFFGYLMAPKTEGTYRVSFYMVEDGLAGSGNAGVFSEHFSNINVSSTFSNKNSDALDPYLPSAIAVNETPAMDGEIIKVGLSDVVAPNANVSVEIVIKNVGLQDWAADECTLEYTIGGSTKSVSVPQTKAGETAAVTVSFKAPSTVGETAVSLRLVSDGETVGAEYSTTMTVGQQSAASAKLDAEIVSTTYSKNVIVGGKNRITIELVNSGSAAWDLANRGIKIMETSGKCYLSDVGDLDDDGKLASAIEIEDNVSVAAGERYFFTFELHSYANSGEGKDYAKPGDIINLNLQLVSDAGDSQGALTDKIPVSYVVDDVCESPVIKYADDAEMTDTDYAAAILSIAVPTRMEPGEVAPIRFTVKNIGTETWTDKFGDPSYIRFGTSSHANFKLVTDPAGINGDAGDRSRIAMRPTGFTVEPGATYTYSAYIKAPSVDQLGDPITYQEFDKVHFTAVGDWLVRDAVEKNLDDIFVPIIVAEPGATLTNLNPSLEEVTDEEVFVLDEEPLFEVASTDGAYTFNDPSKVTNVSGFSAKLISAEIPTEVEPGEKFPVEVTMISNGDQDLTTTLWSYGASRCTTVEFGGAVSHGSTDTTSEVDTTNYEVPVLKDKFYAICDNTKAAYDADAAGTTGKDADTKGDGILTIDSNVKFYLFGTLGGVKVPGIAGSSATYSTLHAAHGATVIGKNGAQYTFKGYLVAPSTPGEYDVTLKLYNPMEKKDRTAAETIKIKVKSEEESSTHTFNDPTKITNVSGFSAKLISAEIPTKVKAGEKFPVEVTMISNGDQDLTTTLWSYGSSRCTTVEFGGAVSHSSTDTTSEVDTTNYEVPVLKDKFYAICDNTKAAYDADAAGTTGKDADTKGDGILTIDSNVKFYLFGTLGGVKVPGIAGSSATYSTLHAAHGATVIGKNGAQYTFKGYLVAPSTPGEYDVTLKLYNPMEKKDRTSTETITIKVEGEEDTSGKHTFNDPTKVEYGKTDYAATLISAEIPTKVQPGEKFNVSVTAVNNGTQAQASWLTSFSSTRYTNLVFGGAFGYNSTDKVDTKNFDHPVIKNKFYAICDATKAAYDADQAGTIDKTGGTKGDGIMTIDANNQRYLFGEVGGVKIPGISGSSAGYTTMNISHVNNGSQPGLFDYKASYTFTGSLVAPYTPGEYEITLKLYCPGNGSTRSSVETVKITVEGEAPEEEKNPNEHIFKDPSQVQNVNGYAATLLSAEVPTQVKAGEKFPVKFTMINNGNQVLATWLSQMSSTRYTTLMLGEAVNYKPGDAAKESYDPPAAVNSFYAICDATKAAYDADQAGTADISGGTAADGILTVDVNNKHYLYGNVGETKVPGIAGSSAMFNTLNISHTSPLVNAGETYTFTGYLVAPTTGGEYTISARVYAPGTKSYRTEAEEIKITVLAEEEVYKTDDQAPVTTTAMNAAIMSASVPERMRIGTTFPITVTVKNTGTADWTAEKVWLGNIDGLFKLTDKTGEAGCNAEMNRIDIVDVETVKSGETYTFTYWVKAPTTEGTQSLKVQMVNDGTAFGETKSIDVFVTSAVSNFVPEEPEYETSARDAEFVKIGMPSDASVVNSEVTASLHVKNTGTQTWTATTNDEAGYYLRYRFGSGTPTYLPVTEDVAQGESIGFTVKFNAPDREKNYSVRVQMVYRNAKGFSSAIGDEILLTGESIIDMGEKNAELVSVKLYDMDGNEIAEPWTILEGDKAQVALEVRNTGSMTWDDDSDISLALLKEKHPTIFSASGAKDDNKLVRSVSLEPGIKVEPGESYVFRFDLHTWTMKGNNREYFMPGTETALELRLHSDGDDEGFFGPVIGMNFGVEMIVGSSEVLNSKNSDLFTDEDDCKLTSQMHHVTYISAKVPSEMSIGQIAPFELTVMNTGTITWREGVNSNDAVRLAVYNAGFGFYSDEDATMGWGSHRNRIHIDQNVLINGQKPASTADAVVKPGDTVTFRGYIKCPLNPAAYVLEVGMINDSSDGELGFTELTDLRLKLNVDVIGRSVVQEEDVDAGDLTYGDLLTTAVGNADYYIANKAFFWDLSVEKEIAPLDDRTQPVGTDVKVLRQILDSQRKRAQAYEEGTDPWNKTPGVGEGYGIFICEGFTPWFLKYSNHNDPKSPHVPYRSEWLNVQLISEYGGMIDADAYGTVTVCNCSVFSKIKLKVDEYKNENKNLRQMHDDFDPTVGDPSVVYDEETIYISYYMGDWDGSAWISGILPTIWETDPRRGEIPIAWPLASALSARIPHVYNWMYDTAKPNDYFVAADNGVAYFNANFLTDPLTAESGITKEIGAELVDDLVKYNTDYFEVFGLDFCMFVISGSYEGGEQYAGINNATIELYNKLSPLGSSHSPNAAGYITYHDGIKTPYVPINIGTDGLETPEKREAAAERLLTNIKQSGQFQYERTVKARATELIQVLDLVKQKRPDLTFKVVDPYTFMRLYRESDGGAKPEAQQKATYEAPKATEVKIDGVNAGGEWSKAAVMTISPESAEVLKHGRNWNEKSLATDQDMTSKMRVMWDSNYLYVLEERTDNDHLASSNSLTMDWVADAGAIFLDTDDKDNENNFYAGDFAVLFNETGNGKVQVWMRRGSDNTVRTERMLAASEYIAAVKVGNGGNYVYEIAIPWSTLGGYKPVAGATIGMTTLAIDGDTDASGGGRQIMWHGSGDPQVGWAIMKFAN